MRAAEEALKGKKEREGQIKWSPNTFYFALSCSKMMRRSREFNSIHLVSYIMQSCQPARRKGIGWNPRD